MPPTTSSHPFPTAGGPHLDFEMWDCEIRESYDFSNPQSLNRYTYAMNNLNVFTDPSGLDPCDPGVATSGVYCYKAPPWTPPNLYDYFPNYWRTSFIVPAAFPYGPDLPTASSFISRSRPDSNNGTPWYQNSCVTSALKSGAISVGVDALGFLPEAGGVARVVGHQAGYVGVVADNVGKNMLMAGTKTTGFLNSATGVSSSDWTTWVSAGITAADFVPVLSDFTTSAAMIWDGGTALYMAHQCP